MILVGKFVDLKADSFVSEYLYNNVYTLDYY